MKEKERIIQALDNWRGVLKGHERYSEIHQELKWMIEDYEDNLVVIIAGEVKAGKSTFINALLGRAKLLTNVLPETAIVTRVRYGAQEKKIVHFKNGDIRDVNDQELNDLTAESGSDGKAMRDSIEYVDLYLPVDLLKKVTIIDTPGLNSQYDHHTIASEKYYPRADQIIWLFNFHEVGALTEIQQLRRLKDHGFKPLGIVNGIDEVDDEEETVDEFLDFNKRRVQGMVHGLIGVSALKAVEAKETGDEETLAWSNWHEVEALFSGLIKQSEDLKHQRLVQRMANLLESLNEKAISFSNDLKISYYIPIILSFIRLDYPALMEKRKTYELQREELQEAILSIKSWFEEPIRGQKQLNAFFDFLFGCFIDQNDRESFELAEAIQIRCQEEMTRCQQEIHKQSESHIDKTAQLNEINSFLVSEHSNLGKKRFIRKKRVEHLIALQDDYNRLVEDKKRDKQHIEERLQHLSRSTNRLTKDLFKMAQKLVSDCQDELKRINLQWHEEFKQLEEKNHKINADYLRDFESHMEALHGSITSGDEVLSLISSNDTNSQASAKCLSLLNELKKHKKILPLELIRSSYLDFWKILQSDRNPERLEISPLRISPIIPSYLSVTHARNELDFHYFMQIINKRRKRVFFILTASILFFLAFMWFGSPHNSNPKDKLDKTSSAIASSMNGKSTQDTNYSPPKAEALQMNWSKADIERFIKDFQAWKWPDNRSGDVNFGRWMTLASWKDFSTYDIEISSSAPDQTLFDSIQYVGNKVYVTTTEKILRNQSISSYQNHYTLSFDSSKSKPVITGFRYELAGHTAPDYDVVPDDLLKFLSDFRKDYMTALNQNDTSYVSGDLTGKAKQDLLNYIGRVAGRGYTFDFTSFEVTHTEKSAKNKYKILANESLIFTDDGGNQTNYNKQKQYTIKVSAPASFAIESIKTLHTLKEKIEKRTVDQVTDAEVGSFMQDYYAKIADGFNGQGFAVVTDYLTPDGKEYKEVKQNIENGIEKGMHMQNKQFKVSQISETDPQHLLVKLIIEEQYYYKDGTGDDKTFEADYMVKVADTGDLLVDENTAFNITKSTPINVQEGATE